jgi:hypothetical protein
MARMTERSRRNLLHTDDAAKQAEETMKLFGP